MDRGGRDDSTAVHQLYLSLSALTRHLVMPAIVPGHGALNFVSNTFDPSRWREVEVRADRYDLPPAG